MPAKKPARLGRPPSSSSAETRTRILNVARQSFAELGFGVTTNKYLATKAGITSGALYHYFDSKIDIYAAVYGQVTESVFDRFDVAVRDVDTFIGRFEAVLEEAHQLDVEDPSLARFLGAVRIDAGRHDEIRPALAAIAPRSRAFIRRLVDYGVTTGEIRPADRDMVLAFIQTVLVGLTDGVSGDSRVHRIAVDSIRAVLEGRLLSAPVPVRSRTGAKPGSKKSAESSAQGRGRRPTAGLPSDHIGTSTRRAMRQPSVVRTTSSS